MTTERRDEVSYSDYLRACRMLARAGGALERASPDEAVEHWLPDITLNLALVYSFVGSNMTARHVPAYQQAVVELQEAKHGVIPGRESGRLTNEPTTGGPHGGIADPERGGASRGAGAPDGGRTGGSQGAGGQDRGRS